MPQPGSPQRPPLGPVTLGALALVPVLVVGFWPNYFATFGHQRLGLHVHAAAMFLWVALLIVQAWLVGRGRLRLHRTLGKASIALVLVVIWTAIGVVQESLRAAPVPVTGAHLQLLALPVGGLAIFAIGYGLGLRYRRDRALHGRYMVVAALGLAGAGVNRLFLFHVPGFGDAGWAGHGGLFALELVTAVLVANDAGLGRVRAPFVVALVLLGLNHAAYAAAPESAAWRAAAEALASLPLLAPWGAVR